MRKMSNGEVGVDLEHVLFMPMEPLQSLYHENFSHYPIKLNRVGFTTVISPLYLTFSSLCQE
jgi:hypothetical protein